MAHNAGTVARSERISTQAVFDHLRVPQHLRSSSVSRRLAKLMRSLGWTTERVRDLPRAILLAEGKKLAFDILSEMSTGEIENVGF